MGRRTPHPDVIVRVVGVVVVAVGRAHVVLIVVPRAAAQHTALPRPIPTAWQVDLPELSSQTR